MTILKKSVLLGMFFVSVIIFPWEIMGEEGRIIEIQAIGESEAHTGISASPDELTIEKNVIVIWLNAINGDEVNIQFEDGETTKNATANPMGFDLDKNGEYAAKYLPFVSTTSLRFIKSGVYPYNVTSQDNKFTTHGTVIVP